MEGREERRAAALLLLLAARLLPVACVMGVRGLGLGLRGEGLGLTLTLTLTRVLCAFTPPGPWLEFSGRVQRFTFYPPSGRSILLCVVG